MAIIHVDDLVIASDGSKETEALVEKLHKRYPFGEWVQVAKEKKVTYTGRTIAVHGDEVPVN